MIPGRTVAVLVMTHHYVVDSSNDALNYIAHVGEYIIDIFLILQTELLCRKCICESF